MGRLSFKEEYEGAEAIKKINLNNIRFAVKNYNNYQCKWMNELRKHNMKGKL